MLSILRKSHSTERASCGGAFADGRCKRPFGSGRGSEPPPFMNAEGGMNCGIGRLAETFPSWPGYGGFDDRDTGIGALALVPVAVAREFSEKKT